MSDVNRTILFGRLGADPVRRETKEGKPVAQFSLATSYRTKDGTYETQWHRVVFWGRLAEIVSDILEKGATVFVEGSYRSRKYETADGQSRLNFEVNAERVQLISKSHKVVDEADEDTEVLKEQLKETSEVLDEAAEELQVAV